MHQVRNVTASLQVVLCCQGSLSFNYSFLLILFDVVFLLCPSVCHSRFCNLSSKLWKLCGVKKIWSEMFSGVKRITEPFEKKLLYRAVGPLHKQMIWTSNKCALSLFFHSGGVRGSRRWGRHDWQFAPRHRLCCSRRSQMNQHFKELSLLLVYNTAHIRY